VFELTFALLVRPSERRSKRARVRCGLPNVEEDPRAKAASGAVISAAGSGLVGPPSQARREIASREWPTVNLQNASPAAWDWQLLGTALGLIFLAQLPGKSALTALVLSSRYRTWPVLLGAGLALAADSVIAVAAGGLLSLLPVRPIHVAAGLVFILFAIFVWRGQPGEGERSETSPPHEAANFMRAFGMTFTAIFFAEWGGILRSSQRRLLRLGTASLLPFWLRPYSAFGRPRA
jgi:putative Ca2+/H+ antiporter (TMEM165/GDT1 family)